MKRILMALIAGSAVFTIAFASAAALSVDGNVIQAGEDTQLACDGNGVDANWGLEVSEDAVYNVRISDISPSCNGALMWVRINGTDTYGPETISGDSLTFSFGGPEYTPAELTALKVWIEG